MSDDVFINNQEDGSVICGNGAITVSGVPSSPSDKVRAFRRRGIRKHLSDGRTENLEWLVVEVEGVRVYVTQTSIIVTKMDLNP